MRRIVRISPFAFALVLVPSAARAQQAAADALFDSARAAMSKGELASACEQFRASDKLDPAVGTELNLADCEEKRGHLASAWELYRTVEEKLSATDERLAFAHTRAQALDPRVPKLTLTLAPGAPKDSSVRDGGVDLGSAAFGVALPVEPGAHELVVAAPGFAARTFQVQLSEGQTQAVTVSPGPANAAAPAAPAAMAPVFHGENPDKTRAAAPSGSSTRTLGFVLGGVGVAGLGVGALAGLLELGKQHAVDDHCQPDKSCTSAGVSAAESGRTLERVSNVGWIVGATALGAGAYFLLTSGPSTKPNTSVALSSNPRGGQLSLRRSW
jgi:hypothetical protein